MTDEKWIPIADQPEAFAKVFATLAIAKNQKGVDDVKMKVYFNTLKDLPLHGVQQAADDLAKQPGGWLPSVGDWFEKAVHYSDTIWNQEQQARLPAPVLTLDDDDDLVRLQQAKQHFLKTVANLRDFTGRKIAGPGTVERLDRALKADRHALEQVPQHYCDRCQDRGWVRTNEHPGQQWTVTGCVCRASNPALNQRAPRGRQ